MPRNAQTAISRRLTVGPDSTRSIEDALSLRFPRAVVALNRLVLRLAPHSAIRRRFVRHVARRAIEAANRRDYEVAFSAFHPDYEMNPPPSMSGLGAFPASLRDRGERIRLEIQWREDWGEFRYEPEEVIDLGDRLLVLGTMVGSGPNSGAGVKTEWADLFTLAEGQVAREQVFFSRSEALAEVGLSDRDRSGA